MQTYHDPHAARWTTMQADYRETLAHAAGLGGADLVATSPPYCDARTYGAGVSWTDADYAALGDAVFAALKPGGHALINVDAPVREWRKGYGTERGFHPWRMMLDWAERVGFRVPDQLVFGRMGQPGFWPMGFRRDHEPLLWFQKPGYTGCFEHLRDVGSNNSHGRGVRSHRNKTGETQKQSEVIVTGDRYRGSIWSYGTCGNGHTGAPDIEAENHPARWPYKLAEDIVRCFCPPAGLAVDPFCGAGTTGAAAIAHGRRFVGGDLYVNEKGEPWASVAHRIMVERTRQQPLFAR
jgi:hypothetical protein